jgi:uncharacterized membrane protein HdeD (DUF308 family)
MPDEEPWAFTEAMRAEILDLLAGLVAVALLVLVLADRAGVARTLVALLFTFFVPGRAIVSNWARMAAWSEIGMSMVLSLGVLTLLATVTLWARIWHPLGLFQIEAAASLAGLAIAALRRRLASRPSPGWPSPSRRAGG